MPKEGHGQDGRAGLTTIAAAKERLTTKISTSSKSRWANQARVTTESFSLSAPKCCGQSHTSTTAFWTVDRVTSAGRLRRVEASSWRVHEMPTSEVGGCARRRVKYEKSSMMLGFH